MDNTVKMRRIQQFYEFSLRLLLLCCMVSLSSCATPVSPPPPSESTLTPTTPTTIAQNMLFISPTEARPGSIVKIHGSGYYPEETITITVQVGSESYLYGAQALENGEYLQEIMLLENLPAGVAVRIEARGDNSGRTLTGKIQITPTDS